MTIVNTMPRISISPGKPMEFIPFYWVGKEEVTVHDRAEAFEQVQKTNVLICDDCKGNGFNLFFVGSRNEAYWTCRGCNGEAEICAYCLGHSGNCECGE